MRLLMTTDTTGGVWRFTQELTEGLLEAGNAVMLVSFGAWPTEHQRSECRRLESRWGERFFFVASEIPLEWMQQNEACFEEGAVLLERLAYGFEAELIHANQFCYGALESGPPRIVTAHSDVLSWGRVCRDTPLEDSPWLRRYCALVQRGLLRADAVTAPTQWMLGALEEGFQMPPRGLAIANGRLVHTEYGQPREVRAVTAGRLWDEAKDVALLDRVRSPMPMMVAGAREYDGLETATLEHAEMLGLLDEEEILRLFAESAVYVCTSRYEPFGLAPLEAALCGCAVAARDIESLHEVWGDGALYFRNADDLSAILTGLCHDAETLTAAQRRAQSRARFFSRERMVAGYLKLYAEVTEAARAA